MRVLVCGGRDFSDSFIVNTVLDGLHATTSSMNQELLIIQGGAQGADRLAFEWAHLSGVDCLPFPANWDKHGNAAGPIRNQQMLDEGRPDLVIAFDGGAGTMDMISRASKAGIPVYHVRCK